MDPRKRSEQPRTGTQEKPIWEEDSPVGEEHAEAEAEGAEEEYRPCYHRPPVTGGGGGAVLGLHLPLNPISLLASPLSLSAYRPGLLGVRAVRALSVRSQELGTAGFYQGSK